MKKKKITLATQNKIDKVNKIMLFAIVVCCASPFLYFVYLGIKLPGVDIYAYIQEDAYTLINMIAAFLNPFVGLVINYMREKLKKFEEPSVIYRNLLILLISQMLMLNTFYIMLIIFLLYKIHGIYNQPFSIAWKSIKFKNFMQSASASLTVLSGYVFVGLLLVRIMFFV